MYPRKLIPFVLIPLLAACAQIAATQSRPEKRVTVTYQVNDPTQPTIAYPYHLIDLITTTIAPASWFTIECAPPIGFTVSGADTMNLFATGHGTISVSDGKLVIAQTPAIHAQIASLLQRVRQDSIPQISIECRFFLVDKQFLIDIDPDPATQDTIIDALAARLLIRFSQIDLRTTTLSTPRITMLSGKSAHFGITQSGFSAITPAGTTITPPPNPAPLPPPFNFDLKAAVTSDFASIHLQIADAFPADITLPEGKSLLRRARNTADPADDRIVLTLLTPRILLHRDIKVDRFGHSYDTPNTLIPIGVGPSGVAPSRAKP